jgi:hypothetical protein
MDIKRYYNQGNITGGIVLIALGLVFLAATQGFLNVNWGTIWPAFVVLAGVLGLTGLPYANTPAKRGAIVQGSTLPILLGIYFFAALNGWLSWALWPVYPLAIGVAFFAGYAASGFREIRFILPGTILTLTGLAFGAIVLTGQYDLLGKIWPVLLILAGIAALVAPITRRTTNQ